MIKLNLSSESAPEKETRCLCGRKDMNENSTQEEIVTAVIISRVSSQIHIIRIAATGTSRLRKQQPTSSQLMTKSYCTTLLVTICSPNCNGKHTFTLVHH